VHVVMTWGASKAKMDAIRKLGGTVLQHGPTLVECMQLAKNIQIKTGATLVPQGHCNIALGQGTVMLEFQDQLRSAGFSKLDAVIVPSAGGALLAGTAVVCQSFKPRTAVFGVEPAEGGANLTLARHRGSPVSVLEGETIADGLRLTTSPCNWAYVKDPALVRDVFQVRDCHIREALSTIIESTGMIVEPTAVVAVAAMLSNEGLQNTLRTMGTSTEEPLHIGVILTGGNVDKQTLQELLPGGANRA
jgi:threonine dehydratase